MKKIKNILVTLSLMVMITFCFTGCFGGNSNNGNNSQTPAPTECVHSYTTSVTAPTCTQKGYTTHTCSKCNKSYTDSYTDPHGHNFVYGTRNYSCSTCGQSEAEYFSFSMATMDGESCYVVTSASAGAVVNGVLEVPRRYESLPVRGIMSWSFSGVANSLKTLVIHDNIKVINDYLFNGTSIWNSDLEYKCPIERVTFDSTCTGMKISANAFYNCTRLSNVNITKNMVKYIPADPVLSQRGGNAEYLFKGTPYFQNNAVVRNGLYYVGDLLLHADPNQTTAVVTIENDTVAINSATFASMTQITTITIPKSVLTIGSKAFYGCNSLATIYYEGTTEEFAQMSIGTSVFSGITARKVICSNGDVTSYRYNGYTYNIGD